MYMSLYYSFMSTNVDDSPFLLVQFSFELPWLRRYAQ